MIQTRSMSEATHSDAELVARSLAGDHKAFGAVVTRYQSLICSLAYSAVGNLGRSEDLAQETFIAAWKQLKQLREPAKLRSWLCGIARNRINNALRREGREPLGGAESLEDVSQTQAPEPLPSDATISREEAAILWRSLERIPEIYREPLILFYRKHQSIETVAAELDLSQDAVRQRLSRGRKLLSEQVTAFVEGALSRTSPGKAFTMGVIAALPVFATSATAATLGATVAKGTTAAKAVASIGLTGAILGPIIGILGAWFGVKASLANATSAAERKLILRLTWIVGGMVLVSLAFMAIFIGTSKAWFSTHPVLAAAVMIGFSLVYTVGLLSLILYFNRRQRSVRLEAAAKMKAAGLAPAKAPPIKTFEYRSRWTLFGIPLVHILLGRQPEEKLRPALGWIAIGDVSIGILLSFGGISVGGISIGGLSVGVVTFGGCVLGVLAGGGLAMGVWAVGGLALGYLALGGCAVAWHAAMGGFAVARHLAEGGVAVATHANDEAAKTFIEGHPFFQHASEAMGHANWLILLCLLPLGITAWHAWHDSKRTKIPDTPVN